MKTIVTAEQIAVYQENGFVLHPGFLSPAEVAELKAAVLEAAASMGKKKVAGGGANMEEGDSYGDKVFTQRLNLWRISPTVKRYLFDAALGRLLSRLSGASGLRLWHDQMLTKEPYAHPTGWHCDDPHWSFYSRDAISIWIALEDATLENGCLWFVPGSHKLTTFQTTPGPHFDSLFTRYPELAAIDPVPAVMKAGDCSFHNGLTVHGAGANMTRRRRIAIMSAYMPVGGTYNGIQNILPDAYARSLTIGDALENNDWNPVVC